MRSGGILLIWSNLILKLRKITISNFRISHYVFFIIACSL